MIGSSRRSRTARAALALVSMLAARPTPSVEAAPETTTVRFAPPFDAEFAWTYDTIGVTEPAARANRANGGLAVYADAFIGGSTAEATQVIWLKSPEAAEVRVRARLTCLAGTIAFGFASWAELESIWQVGDDGPGRAAIDGAFDPEDVDAKVKSLALLAAGGFAAVQGWHALHACVEIVELVHTAEAFAEALHEAKKRGDAMERTIDFRFRAQPGWNRVRVGVRATATALVTGSAIAMLVGQIDRIEVSGIPHVYEPTTWPGTWARAYGTPLEETRPSIARAPDGTLAVSAYLTDQARPTPPTPDGEFEDLAALRLRPDGTTIWAKAYASDRPHDTTGRQSEYRSRPPSGASGPSHDGGYRTALVRLPDGGLAIAYDSVVLRLDDDGQVVSARQYALPGPPPRRLATTTLAVCPDGDLLLGAVDPRAPGEAYDPVVVVRLRPDGSVRWARRYDALGGATTTHALPLADGDALLVSSAVGPSHVPRIAIARVAPDGRARWAKTLEVEADPSPEYAPPWFRDLTRDGMLTAAAATPEGELLVVQGQFRHRQRGWTATQLGPDGARRWSRRVHASQRAGGAMSYIHAACRVADGWVLVGGGTEYQAPRRRYGHDVHVWKLADDGGPVWWRTLGDTYRGNRRVPGDNYARDDGDDFAESVAPLDDGGCVLAAHSNSFSYVPGYAPANGFNHDVLVVRMGPNGGVDGVGSLLYACPKGRIDTNLADATEAPLAVAPESVELLASPVTYRGRDAPFVERSVPLGVGVRNHPPVAAFEVAPAVICAGRLALFDSSGSNDPDGAIAALEWDFGDGQHTSGRMPSHAYARPGTYVATLVVRDGDGAEARVSRTVTVVAAPTAAFTVSPASPLVGIAADFDASRSVAGGVAAPAYAWDFGDGSTATGVRATHAFAQAGAFAMTLTVTDAAGVSTSRTERVTVGPANLPPVAVATVAPPAPVVGEPVTFDGTGSSDPDGTIARFAWEFGDGARAEGGRATHAYARAESITAQLTVTDASGSSARTTLVVVVAPANLPPQAAFSTAPARPATGTVVTFDGSGSTDPDGAVATWAWQFGDGASATGASATHAYAGAGTFAVTLTVTDAAGATSAATASIEVRATNATPTAQFSFLPARPGPGQTVSFQSTGSFDADGTLVARTWSFGDGTSASGAAATHTFAAAGTYAVRFDVLDDSGAEASVTHDVVVAGSNLAPVAEFGWTPVAARAGEPVTFDGGASHDREASGTVEAWAWTFGDGTSGTGAQATHTFAGPGVYGVRLRVTDAEGATGEVVHDVVLAAANHAPTARFVHAPPAPRAGETVTFVGATSSDPDPGDAVTTWTWTFPGGGTASGKTVTHVFSEAGRFEVELTVTDGAGATGTTSVSIDVRPALNLPPVATFTWSPVAADPRTDVTFVAGTGLDSDGSVASWTWDFGDGATASGTTVVHRFAARGTYDVTLTVTDDEGATGTTTHRVVVAP